MNNEEKTFVILSPGFASSENDSTCLPMQQDFVKTISSLYPDLQIIILSFQYPYYKKCYKWFGATVVSFNGRNKGGLPRLLLRREVSRVLEKIHKEKRMIGLLSFWLNECAAVGKSFGAKNNIPHFCWILGQDARKGNNYFKSLQPQSNELVALSDFLQKECEHNYGLRPLHVIPPGIEPKNFTATERDIDFLAVGSLISLKRFEIFIEIIAIIKKRVPDVKASLIGTGPEKNKLQKLISEAGIQDNINLTAELSHDEVLCLMQRSKILIHPSSYEGFSGVCLEALSAGAQVVSFCRAMDEDITNWHTVETKEEMVNKCVELSKTCSKTQTPIIVQPMSETVKKMMALYLEK